jgi:hypothetical protein
MKNSISQIENVAFVKKTLPKVGKKRFLFLYIKLANAVLTEDSRQIDEVFKALSHLNNLRLNRKKYVYLIKSRL